MAIATVGVASEVLSISHAMHLCMLQRDSVCEGFFGGDQSILHTSLFRHMPEKTAKIRLPHTKIMAHRRATACATARVVMLALAAGASEALVVDPLRVVMKFGGSSVRDAERITEVCKLIKDQKELGCKPHVVCSAMGQTTNNLLSAANGALESGLVDLAPVRALHETTAKTLGLESTALYTEVTELLAECERTLEGVAMLGELSLRTRDRVVSYGERCSARMVAAYLEKMGVRASQIEAWDLGVLTDSRFGDAAVVPECWPTIKERVEAIPEGTVGVITGFIGKDEDGCITTLGRGGSDLTASLIGAASGFDEVQVWKDVDGILSADPRICAGAVPVPRVSFSEAAELAYFGAKVLHPVAMQPAVQADMPVRVKNSYNPTAPGTLINGDSTPRGLVSAITSKSDIILVDITSTRMLGAIGFLAHVFKSFERRKLSVDVVATSEVSVSLTLNRRIDIKRKKEGPLDVEDESLRGVIGDLCDVAEVDVKGGRSIVTLIANLAESSNVMAVVFQVMSALGVQVEMISQGASKVNISLVVPLEREVEVVRALHQCFFEDRQCIVPLADE
jgi:aspartate kinase